MRGLRSRPLYLVRENGPGLDVPNLVEEIESLGRQQRSELRNRLSVLLMRLLKWEYQSNRRSRSWNTTIRIQRIDIARLIKESPSLKPYLSEAIDDAYKTAVIAAADETGLSEATFPDKGYVYCSASFG